MQANAFVPALKRCVAQGLKQKRCDGTKLAGFAIWIHRSYRASWLLPEASGQGTYGEIVFWVILGKASVRTNNQRKAMQPVQRCVAATFRLLQSQNTGRSTKSVAGRW